MSSLIEGHKSAVIGPSKTYVVYDHKTYDIKVCEANSDIAIYFSEHHSWTPKVPDLVFHSGADRQGLILGVGHFSWFGANTVGLGDPANPIEMVWEKLVGISKWTHSEYKFEFPFGADQKRTTFIWRRIKTRTFSDQGDMELVIEGKNDEVVADYVGFGLLESMEKRATVTIKHGLGDKLELMVWLTGLSLVELSRRRARARRYKGG